MSDKIPQKDKFYLSELQLQCEFALRALDYANYTYRNRQVESIETWYHIQMFLVSVGNVSKLLVTHSNKPKLKKYKEHHENLVTEYNLPNNYFLKEKAMRNHFEHYDEQLIDWLARITKAPALNNVGPIELFQTMNAFEYLKHFDPVSGKLYFAELSIDLLEAGKNLDALSRHIEEILQREPL